MQRARPWPPLNLPHCCRSPNDGGHRDINQRRIHHFQKPMAEAGNSMLYSLLLFVVTLSLQEISLVFLFLLTFIGNFQETSGVKTGWGAVILAEAVALVAAGTVHRVCITTCFLFSAAILYEVNQISGVMASKSESKGRRH
ncbi:unnamed protein product [Lactuca saligna]|uniref:Dolichyl-diphosphooligosaccharide--protein glycosyltransferase subunit KCP2 n=1 Tax=Lactuca saligna TaxID=75948 RepID=A0AA36ED56_LACSI|nr:unnamed protein product [Lactuca saligna]